MKNEQMFRVSTIYIISFIFLLYSSFPFLTNKSVNAITINDLLPGDLFEEIDSETHNDTQELPSLEEIEVIDEEQEEQMNSSIEEGSGELEINIITPIEDSVLNKKLVEISGQVKVPEPKIDLDAIIDLEAETEPDLDIESELEIDPDNEPKPEIILESDNEPKFEAMSYLDFDPESDIMPDSDSELETEIVSDPENILEPENTPEQEMDEDPEKVMVEIFKSGDELLGSVEADEFGNWSFEYEFEDGDHTIYAIATDSLNDPAVSTEISFSIDTIRPFIWVNNHPYDDSSEDNESTTNEVNPLDNSCPPVTPNMTRVCLDSSIVLFVEDNNPLFEDGKEIDNLKDTVSSIRLYKNSNDNEMVEYEKDIKEVKLIDSEKATRVAQITLSLPSEKELDPFTTYYVSAGGIMDKAGNAVHARIWKFTTGNQTDKVIFDEKDPHGNYSNNVSFCANCHSTHAAKEDKLVGGGTHLPSNEVYFCMTCHDGTVAPPPAMHAQDIKYEHTLKIYVENDDEVDVESSSENRSCSSCHDPHLSWTEDNPNLLKSHYVFKNHPLYDENSQNPLNHLLEGYSSDNFDSQIELCETCHDNDVIGYGGEVKNAYEKGVTYEVFQYKDSSTAIGGAEDYSLCLRCHRSPETSDINAYYLDGDSKHNFKALDGSGYSLNGNMPCAECHDTHGSSNMKLLKETLGHGNQETFNNEGIDEWTPELERKFCLTCHNNVTELYGLTAQYNRNEYSTQVHNENSGKSCAECHGESFSEAVHAPKPGEIP